MLVTFANPTNSSASTPSTAPPSGTIHTVGSALPSTSAANVPARLATRLARNSPIRLGQNATRCVVVSRARLPMIVHQVNPPPRPSSTAIIQSRPGSPNGCSGGAAASSLQGCRTRISTTIATDITASSGATILLTHSIDTGPFTSTSQDATIATSAIVITSPPFGLNSVPATALITLTIARPHITARIAFQPAPTSGNSTSTNARTPFAPYTLRSPVYCSMPYFADGMHEASDTRTRSEERRVGKECRSRWS